MQTALGAEALRSMAEAKSLLVKRKAPTGKRRKAPIVNAQLLKRQRQLLSPRTSHSQPVRLTSPSVRGDGVPPTELEGSSSSSPPPLQDASRPRVTKRRKLRSSVWKEFEPIYNGLCKLNVITVWMYLLLIERMAEVPAIGTWKCARSVLE
ncbi:unnamed protein product [Urochloa humidicola]